MHYTGLTVLLVAAVAGICSCQDCTLPTDNDVKGVIEDIILLSGHNLRPTIDVMMIHPVCLAFSATQDRYRYVSVVVKYTCTGNTNCPSSTAVEQIESECINGMWSNSAAGNTQDIRSVPTQAGFLTATRENCTICLSPELITASGIPLPTDHVTHCVACDSACEQGPGFMRCFGFLDTECCNFYNNGMCVDECPSPFVGDTDHVCVCQDGKTGDNCEEDIDCLVLGNPANGLVTLTTTTHTSVATYTCNPGYSRIGDGTRTCQSSGDWSGSEPMCIEIICGSLDNPSNGKVLADADSINSEAIYSCNPGYALVGDVTRTCQNSGIWSDKAPTCIVDCGVLDDPTNGMVSNSTIFDSTATYTCDTGYSLTGNDTTTCLISGNWSSEPIICTIVDCYPLVDPGNGMVSFTATTYNSVATYSCDTGYDQTGDDTRTCQSSGVWSGSEPTCTIADCGGLGNPEGGVVSVSETTYDSMATYSCNPRHTLIMGDDKRTCQSSGVWSGNEPICMEDGGSPIYQSLSVVVVSLLFSLMVLI